RRLRHPRPRTPKARSCPGSCPILGLHHLEGLVNPLLDACGLPAQVPQLAEALHPFGIAGASRASLRGELFLQGLAHELLERLAAFGGLRLGPAEEDVRDLDGGLHAPILPYLRESDAWCLAPGVPACAPGQKRQERAQSAVQRIWRSRQA